MIFNYDPGLYRDKLANNGYAHLKDLLSKRMVSYLQDFYADAMADQADELSTLRISGKKRQFVFDFPSKQDSLEFRAGMARLTGLEEDKITISERHLKVYDKATDPWPAPHKDRAASQISIGLPVFLSKGSTICAFPKMDLTPNPHDHAIFLNEETYPGLGQIYQTEEAVMLNEKVGDLMLFNGSAVFHERVRAAGTAVLYIKINDKGDDPLGENLYQSEELELA